MVNPVVSSGASKVGGGLFGKFLRIKWGYFIVVILFVQAVSVGLDNGGGLEIIKSLGERFFNITQSLHNTSIYVIENDASFSGYWDFIKVLWSLFSNAYLIFMWLKLFDYLWGKSPWFNESEGFKNMSFALFTFIILQIFYLLLFSTPLEGQSNIDLFLSPINVFWDFLSAVVLIFSSSDFNSVIEPFTNSTRLNSCSDPTGCVI